MLTSCAMVMRRRRRAIGFVTAISAAAIAIVAAVQAAGAMTSGIAIFPATVTFGNQIVSTTTPSRVVSVTNVGPDALNFTNISVSGDFAQVNTCGSALASSATCSVVVTFTPTTTGARTGSLTFLDDAPGATQTIALAGTGVAAPTSGSATPAGSYVVTIQGTAGQLTHTAAPSLTVQ